MTIRPRSRSNPLKLTYETGMAICERLFPICDRRESLSRQLQEDGFSAFLPREKFADSFCSCEEARLVHQRSVTEEAKESLSNMATYLPGRPGQMKHRYSSDFVAELKRRRDESNSCGELEIEKRFPRGESWIRWQHDPCVRSQTEFNVQNPERFATLSEAAKTEQWRRFEFETRSHSSGLGKGREVSRDDRCQFVVDAALRYGSILGFSHRKSKSAARRPAVWKPLNEDWDIRWVVPDTESFMFAPFVERENRLAQADLDADLVLCPSSVQGNVASAPPGNYLPIQYKFFIPHYTLAYRKFYDYDELELVVKAHFALLSLVLHDVESAALSVVGQNLAPSA
jgi:hypothetical protein